MRSIENIWKQNDLLHSSLDFGHSGHASHEKHFSDLGRLNLGVVQRLSARFDGLLDQVPNNLLEFGPKNESLAFERKEIVVNKITKNKPIQKFLFFM